MLKCRKYIYVLHEKVSPHRFGDGVYFVDVFHVQRFHQLI